MDNSEYEQLQRDLDKYRLTKESSSEKVLGILSAGKALAHKTITHEFEGVTFETIAYAPKEVKEKLSNAIDSLQSDSADVDFLLNACAEFMASVCVDEELKDKSVWIAFDEVSGALIALTKNIFRELSATDVETKTFRRK